MFAFGDSNQKRRVLGVARQYQLPQYRYAPVNYGAHWAGAPMVYVPDSGNPPGYGVAPGRDTNKIVNPNTPPPQMDGLPVVTTPAPTVPTAPVKTTPTTPKYNVPAPVVNPVVTSVPAPTYNPLTPAGGVSPTKVKR